MRKNNTDIELLSAYVDGELSPAEKKYIEATAISGAGQSSSHRYKITVMGIDYYEKEHLNLEKCATIKMQNVS